jgi:hypothetical protein
LGCKVLIFRFRLSNPPPLGDFQRVGTVGAALHPRRVLTVRDGAVARLIGRHPRHDHGRALLVAQCDVHLRMPNPSIHRLLRKKEKKEACDASGQERRWWGGNLVPVAAHCTPAGRGTRRCPAASPPSPPASAGTSSSCRRPRRRCPGARGLGTGRPRGGGEAEAPSVIRSPSLYYLLLLPLLSLATPFSLNKTRHRPPPGIYIHTQDATTPLIRSSRFPPCTSTDRVGLLKNSKFAGNIPWIVLWRTGPRVPIQTSGEGLSAARVEGGGGSREVGEGVGGDERGRGWVDCVDSRKRTVQIHRRQNHGGILPLQS